MNENEDWVYDYDYVHFSGIIQQFVFVVPTFFRYTAWTWLKKKKKMSPYNLGEMYLGFVKFEVSEKMAWFTWSYSSL